MVIVWRTIYIFIYIYRLVSKTHLIQNTFVSLHRKTVTLPLIARKLRWKRKTSSKIIRKHRKEKEEEAGAHKYRVLGHNVKLN